MGEWVEYSQELEALLAMLPQSSSIERAGTAATIEELQARIQWLDFQLSVASEVGLERNHADGRPSRLLDACSKGIRITSRWGLSVQSES